MKAATPPSITLYQFAPMFGLPNPSLLTFTSATTNRSATISIAPGPALASTRVDMVVSPSSPSALRR
ncbi:MAG: hypothetical protein EXQ84_01490 [Rhodospirillaceae bacterium]|nr:hypothetical protein [Rhodospirillaceae bacterium]